MSLTEVTDYDYDVYEKSMPRCKCRKNVERRPAGMLRSRVNLPVFWCSMKTYRRCPKRNFKRHRSSIEESQLVVLQGYSLRCKV